MTDKTAMGLPFPSSTGEGVGSNAHLLHQEVAKPPESMQNVLLAAGAQEIFIAMAELQLTPEDHTKLADACTKIMEDAAATLHAVGLPLNSGITGPNDDPEAVYLPYLTLVTLHMLAAISVGSLPDRSEVDRFAWIAEMIRGWASFSAVNSALHAGIAADDVMSLTGTRTLHSPPPVHMVQQIISTRRQVKEEAAARGITPEALVAEKRDELQAAVATAKSPTATLAM